MSDPYDKYVDLIEVNNSDLYGASLNYDSARKAVEQAVLEERERYAKIAEEREPTERLLPFANDDMNKGAEIGQYEAGERIAEAIRKDPTCPA